MEDQGLQKDGARVVCVWREESDYGGTVRDFLADFERRTGKEIESLNPDTREGSGFATAYDIVEYPTIVALDASGKVLEMWRGLPLPMFDYVNYYLM